MTLLSRVQICLCLDYRAFKVAMSRLSCVQRYLCPDFCAFICVFRPYNFEGTAPLCAVISVWTYRLSAWDLNPV